MSQSVQRLDLYASGKEPMQSPDRRIDSEVTEEAIRALLDRQHIEEAALAAERRRKSEPSDDLPGNQFYYESPETSGHMTGGEAENAAPKRRVLRLPQYQPKWTHTLAVLALTVTLARPWLLPMAFLLIVAVLAISYLTLGHDRVREMVEYIFARLEASRPELAERLKGYAIGFSKRSQKVLNRLPESWVQGLYIPDFELRDDLPEKMREDPFERLAQQMRDN